MATTWTSRSNSFASRCFMFHKPCANIDDIFPVTNMMSCSLYIFTTTIVCDTDPGSKVVLVSHCTMSCKQWVTLVTNYYMHFHVSTGGSFVTVTVCV